jgi:integrase/recombinase XerC
MARIDTPLLPAAMQQWLQYLLQERRYASHTVAAYRRDLHLLVRSLPDTPLERLGESHIRHTLARLHGQGYTPRSLARALAAWRGFFQWWAPQAGLPANPAHGVRAPKQPRGLPKALSVEQAQVLLDQPGLPESGSVARLRDQAMFEILYSSGLRLAELVSLDWRYLRTDGYESTSWLMLDEGDVIVQGKGGKTRRLPLGGKAVQASRRWLQVRSQFVQSHTATQPGWHAALFLGERGKRISPRVVQAQLNKLAQQAGLPVNVHPHSLRHSFASHMLQSSHDLRAVQELLGHANISTTQIYTRLDFQHLAQAYDQAHPRAGRRSSTPEKK